MVRTFRRALIVLVLAAAVAAADEPDRRGSKPKLRILAGEFVSFQKGTLKLLLPTEPRRVKNIKVPAGTPVMLSPTFDGKARRLTAPAAFRRVVKGAQVSVFLTRTGKLSRVDVVNDPERSGDSPPDR
jgi:hypothetical protein